MEQNIAKNAKTTDADAIVVGSGIGGLTAALALARAGKKVIVLEQHYVPGGWCHSFMLNGQKFSPGVHYIGSLEPGATTTRLLSGLGIANDVPFFRIDNKGFEKAWLNGKKIPMAVGIDNLLHDLSERFPKDKKGIAKFLHLFTKINEELLVLANAKTVFDYIALPFRLRHLIVYGLVSLKTILDRYIKNPLLKDVLSMQCGDHALAPSKVSFVCHVSLMNHYMNGGYYPVGGGGAIVKALTTAIKKHGGEVKTGKMVKRILVEGEKVKKVSGVELQDGTILKTNCIVSNTDPHKTFFEMVGEKHLSKKLTKRVQQTSYSLSSLILFLTLDMDVKKAGINSGNIWMSQAVDLDKQYEKISKIDPHNEDEFPCLFISCSTLKDPVSYNGRYHNFELVTFVDYATFKKFRGRENYQDAEYMSYKKNIANKFLKSLEKVLPGVRDHIIQMELGTPKTNEFYINCTGANVYGTEKNLKQLLFPFTSKTEIDGLYLCGASTTSHGVTGAGFSGIHAAASILNCTEDDLLKTSNEQQVQIFDAEDDSEWPEWIHQKMRDKKNHFREAKIIPLNSYITANDPMHLKTGTDNK